MTAKETPDKTHLVKTVRVFVHDNDAQQRIEDRKLEQAYLELRERAETRDCVVVGFTLSTVCAVHETVAMAIHTVTAQILSKQAIAEAQAAQRFSLGGPRRG